MRVIKIVSIVVLVGILVYVFMVKDSSQTQSPVEEKHEYMESTVPHDSDENQEVSPFYQGEVVSVEQGGGYTYIEVLEKTDMSFWIAVEKADVQLGDYILFQKELVAKNFHSKALDRTFEEIMFASNLQYRVSE